MKNNDSSIAIFTGLGHGVFHGFELVIPLFVPIWLSMFDVSATTLGLVVGAGYALIGLFAPLAGVLADVYGSKRLVLLSIGGMGLSFAALSVLQSVVALTATLMIWGAMASLYHPSGLSLISRSAEQRGTVLAYHGAGETSGWSSFRSLRSSCSRFRVAAGRAPPHRPGSDLRYRRSLRLVRRHHFRGILGAA